MNTGPLGVFLGQYRAAVRTVVLAVAAMWYLSLDHPTGSTALSFVVGCRPAPDCRAPRLGATR